MGEGGALLIADEKHNEPAEVLREKGTNRSRFFRGQVDKYTWVGYGSSYLPSDLNAAYLWAQLERADDINENRLAIWNRYYHAFVDLADQEIISLPVVPKECVHNAHMFYMKCRGLSERTALIAYLRDRDVQSTFHYIPLHSAPAGAKVRTFCGRRCLYDGRERTNCQIADVSRAGGRRSGPGDRGGSSILRFFFD